MSSRHLLAVSGLVLICAAGVHKIQATRPGRLEASEPRQTWRGTHIPGGKVEAAFTLANTGGAVRVVDVESSCGCAVPQIEREVIPAGETLEVKLNSIPFQIGERTVSVTLHTDSPLTPTVTLTLQMIGTRPPPFTLQATGELQWPNGMTPQEEREIAVFTVESPEKCGRPSLRSDIPFLQFEFVAEEESPYTEEGLVQRTYRYRVKPRPLDQPGTITGFVEIVPPWEEESRRLPVFGRAPSGIRVVPAFISLQSASPSGGTSEATLSIIGDGVESDFSVEDLDGPDGALQIARKETQPESKRYVQYSVRLRPDRPVFEGTKRLVIRDGKDGSQSVTVPVSIAQGGR